MDNRRTTVAAALIGLICFFLPWIQVSCGATHERATGIDLARDGNAGLWLIPLLMAGVIFVSLRLWKPWRELGSIANLLAALISAYLMNRERLKFEDTEGLIQVGITGWFWLGLGSSVAIVILSTARLLRIRKVATDA